MAHLSSDASRDGPVFGSSLHVHERLPSTLWVVGNSSLKALVWFWLIDETLSANLVYQSDYEIGSTTPKWWSNGENHDDGDGMVMIKCLDLEKKKEKNKKLKVKVKLFGLVIETLSECDHI